MNFYYFSIFSLIPLSLAYGALFGLLLWLARLTRGMRMRGAFLGVLGLIFALTPIAEEVWIAREFAQACKMDGTAINKTVRVDGFYDSTRSTHLGPPTPQAIEAFNQSGYVFLEMKGKTDFVRLERIDGQWKPISLKQPTARYWYSMDDGRRVTHKVYAQTATVTDSQSGEVLASYTRYHRKAPWFFISSGIPNKICDDRTRSSFLIYRQVLLPLQPSNRDQK